MKILVTGSSGLIGGEAVEYFESLGHNVVGLDNNMRKEFFGEAGDTSWNMHRIFHKTKNFIPMPVDIRDEGQLYDVFCPSAIKKYTGPFDVIIHCAAQPSHDKAREIPELDHSVNVLGTLKLLEMTRKYSPNAVFIFMSTNKVYGDAPNEFPFTELETRYGYNISHGGTYHGMPFEPFSYRGLSWDGINEDCGIDQSTHSIFGTNKAAADLLVQEYARTYGLRTFVFRGGCLTGPGHSGVELHGFLSYLVKCAVTGKSYHIYGYKGKQVRDNIHSYDVVRAMAEIIANPREPGSVYNLGGGRENSISILEAIEKIQTKIGKSVIHDYVDQARVGDHQCYISDMTKFRTDYPNWKVTKTIDDILDEMIASAYRDVKSEDDYIYDYDLNEDSIVLDIGAFRGNWSEEIIKRYNSNVGVYEPTEEFYQECVRKFADNEKVTVLHSGLSDKNEIVELKVQGVNTSAYRGEMPHDHIFDVWTEKVMFDDAIVLGVIKRDIDLASINCEGGEYKILPRLIETRVISKFRNIQIQFHNFVPGAKAMREDIRRNLRLTHREKFCYDWRWESWERL